MNDHILKEASFVRLAKLTTLTQSSTETHQPLMDSPLPVNEAPSESAVRVTSHLLSALNPL